MARNLRKGLFITATDTGAGKTWTTIAIMSALRRQGMRVAGMKPVATGCEETAAGLRNADALSLQAGSSVSGAYEIINPYAFKPPIAPHLAALDAGIEIEMDRIITAYAALSDHSDMVLVEGVGGWRVPLGSGRFLVDLVRLLKLPVVLVVGLRLGCINHAVLTAEVMEADGVQLTGWVANLVDPDYTEGQRTIDTLTASIPAPLLAALPFLPIFDAGRLAGYFNVAYLQR
ncbi:MAG: dethiobiotin synthase [Gammaproteobacteria bacterium]